MTNLSEEATLTTVLIVPDENGETGTLTITGDIEILVAAAVLIMAAFEDDVVELDESDATGVDIEAA